MVERKPKVVVLGGGTGMPVLLSGLKKYDLDLSVIVTVADDGGSSGKIRETIEVPAPGDIRNVIASLANVDEELGKLFQYRFEIEGELGGHALGNLVLIALNNMTGNFYEAVKKLATLFRVNANIIPIVDKAVTLHALMDDGTIVSGESNIPVKHKKINRVYLTPNNIKPLPIAVETIRDADLIIISPGSLYTSILPNIIFGDIVRALNETKAKTLYVCNIMTQNGETNHYDATAHIEAIYNHIGDKTINSIIVHNKAITKEMQELYAKEQSFPVLYDKIELEQLGLHVIEEDILDAKQMVVRHNTDKLAAIIYEYAKNIIIGKG